MVLWVKKNRVPGENHRPVASHWQTLSDNVIKYTSLWAGLKFEIQKADKGLVYNVLLMISVVNNHVFQVNLSINYNDSTNLLKFWAIKQTDK
jgi:hypothetical protein